MGVMIGLAFGGRTPGDPVPPVAGETAPANPAPALPLGVHSAFNSGIDCYRRADYERADRFLKLAQAGQEDLTAEERLELANVLRINDTALKARREGADQLRQAEQAVQAGRLAEAERLLRGLTTNQFLTAGDKAKVQRLLEKVRPERVAADSPKDGSVTPAVLAHTKLQQARQLMAKANYDAAEALAHEVQQMKVTFRPGEDTPLRVLNDIARIRSDVKRLLSSARIALQCGDLERAENLANAAAKSGWSVSQLWGDSPAKVLKDCQAARLRQAGSTAEAQPARPVIEPVKATTEPKPSRMKPAPAPTTPEPAKEAPISDLETAHFFLQEGRLALKRGDHAKARECAAKAQALKVTFHWWEDNPAKLTADIQQAVEKESRAHAKEATPAAPAPEKATAKATRPAPATVAKDKAPKPTPVEGSATAEVPGDNPRAALQKARDQYSAGNLDEAEHLAVQVQATGFKGWGLFEETPEKLLADIRTAKAKRGQVEAARLLREARAHFDKGEYDAARTLAYQAERLHGPYSLWDLGDRPAKLIAEIDTAQANLRKKAMPPAPTEVAHKDAQPAPAAVARKDAPPAPPAAVARNEAPPVPAAAYPTLPAANPAPATTDAVRPAVFAGEPAKETNRFSDFVPPSPAPMPTPPAPLPVPEMTTAAKPVAPAAPAAPPAPAPEARPDVVKKQQAHALLAEARHLQRDGRLVEARHKALEAQKVGTSWTADEDRPDRALLELADLAHRRIEHLQQQATDLAATAFADPGRFQKAEANLAEARQLAQGFALDTQAIDARVSWVRQTRQQMADSQAKPAAPAVAQATPPAQKSTAPPTPQQQGQELLDKARMELKRGELETARRLAVEVYTGKYGLQDQADAVLHSIDVEEFNQKVLTVNRSFEAGLAAYLHKDYAQAATIFRSLEVGLLSKDKQARLKEIMLMPEMQPGKVAQAPAAPAPATPPASANEPGKATATDAAPARTVSPEANYVQQVQALQEVQFQKLRDDGLKAQRDAMERVRAGDIAQALEILQEYLNTLKDVPLAPEKVAMLQRPVETRLQHFKKLKAQEDFEKERVGSKDAFNNLMQREAQIEEHKKKQVAELMEKYHKLYDQAKYAEAEMAATQAHELDPENTAAAAAVHVARIQRNHIEYEKLKERKEAFLVKGLDDAEEVGPAADMKEPLKFDDERWKYAKERKPFPKDGWGIQIKTEKQREIERRLSLPISLDFRDQPLKNVLEDLRDLTGINIVPDLPALEAENISLDRPITMHLEGVSTKSALTLVLHQAHLIYVIADEVVKVTTEAFSRGQTVTRTYQVADLIIPVENHGIPDAGNVPKILDRMNNQAVLQTNGSTPFLNANAMRTGTTVGSPTGGSATAASANQPGTAPANGRAPGQTLEDVLIKMITSTIKPESWSDMGGPGTIEYFPLGMALVINQTPDIQEQVAELLQALRRLQDMEVTVEVRFISLDESFFERIGLDFNLNVVTNNSRWDPIITSSNGFFQPFGFNNRFNPNNFITGLVPGGSNRPIGSFTEDLNIPILNSSFGPAIPPFGGFPNAPGSDGGLSLGLAFLSDVQVFMFLEAAQADRRTNVMTAPKLTLFNGQSSTINIMEFQFFVTSMVVTQINGQVVFTPVNQPIPVGSPQTGMPSISLAVQAVVSADRRFVRLNLNPLLTNISSPVTALFPVTTFITPIFESGAQGQPVPFTQYLQQPSFQTVDIFTTVLVPDGGTVLLGGMKTLREGRNEFGPPILSKLPYISRLFRNVGFGRETESLMIMVTPRIIINEEEETRQTGVGQGLQPAGGAPGVAGPGGAPATGPGVGFP